MPSKQTRTSPLERMLTLTFNGYSGNSSCFDDITCGQIGVTKTPPTSGCTGTPPAESACAVDPVGVLTSSPSAWIVPK